MRQDSEVSFFFFNAVPPQRCLPICVFYALYPSFCQLLLTGNESAEGKKVALFRLVGTFEGGQEALAILPEKAVFALPRLEYPQQTPTLLEQVTFAQNRIGADGGQQIFIA